MNEMIELHDSELVALSWADGVAIILLHPVRVHRSEGRPGQDPGTLWLQEAMFTVTDATISTSGKLPATVQKGTLTIGAEVREKLIPAAGVFVSNIKFDLELSGQGHFKVSCDQLMIALTGEAKYLESFEPPAD